MSEARLVEARRNGVVAADKPNPEVVPKAQRRRFGAGYKLRILREVEACSQPGEVGALLRREGLYSSLLSDWRRQRDAGMLEGLAPKKRGRKPNPEARENARLTKENARLRRELEQAHMIIAVQKKLGDLLQRFEDQEPETSS